MNNKKEMILEKAIKLLSAKGIYQTTLKDIAEEAGISKGTLFYYYPSKDELLYDILDTCLAEITQTMQKFFKGSQRTKYSNAFEFVFDKLLVESEFLVKITYYLIDEALIGDKVLLEKLRMKYRAWRQEFKEMFAFPGKDLSEAEKNARATILLGVIDGISVQYLLDPHEVDLKEIALLIEKLLLFDKERNNN